MFTRDESKPGHPVMDEWKPECLWVLAGEGVPTVKLDGTNVKIEHGQLLKRQKPKERDYDEASYVPCVRDTPADRWAWEAFDAGHKGDAVYELLGPKVQGNSYALTTHKLVRVVPPDGDLVIPSWGYNCPPLDQPVSFDSLRAYLAQHAIEGLVFHHPDDDRLAKIKRRDFGLKWPA